MVPYFYLSDPSRRRCSREFLTRAYARKGLPKPNWIDGLRHYMNFAGKALDAFIAWARPETIGPIRVLGAQPLHQLAAEGRGGVLIVSHLGNAELCRARLAEDLGRPVNVLLHTRHAVHYNRLLRAIRPEVAAQTIQVTDIGPETAIALKERVERGEWIAIAGDRTPIVSKGRVSRALFLGRPAAFSQGPFILAAVMGCPVFLMFCLRDEDGHTVTFEHFADDIRLPRRNRREYLDGLVGRYAEILERTCLMAPLQWYNFYDFWA